MKKFLILLAVLMAALPSFARLEYIVNAGNGVNLSGIQGCYSKIDTLALYFSGSTYKLDATQSIPEVTIGSTKYPGNYDQTRNRIYWPINITTPDALPSNNNSFTLTTISYDFTSIKAIKADDNTEITLGEITTNSWLKIISKKIALAKYQIVGQPSNFLTEYYSNFTLSYPTKNSDPSSGSKKILKGKYQVSLDAIDKSQYYISAYYSASNYDGTKIPLKAIVVKADGTEIDRFDATFEEPNIFSTNIDRPISTDGKYYIIYDVSGRMTHLKFNDPNGMLSIIAPIKVGPYTIDSNAADSYIASSISAVGVGSPIYTDNLPKEMRFKVANAVEVFQKPGSDLSNVTVQCFGTTTSNYTNKVNPEVKFDGNEVVVSLDEINAEILKGLAFTPSSLRVEGLQNVTSGYTANAETIFFTSTGYLSVSYKPTAATPVGSLNAYVKTTGDEIELPEGEEITLKLDTDAGTTHEIYFRWTPKESPVTFSSRAAEADSDDFIKHTDAITVAGPGTLEYYTRLSNTTSEVKSIRVVAKQPEEEEPGISTNIADIPTDTDEEGEMIYYRIDGSRAVDLSSPGIYIGKSASGATRKVLVK